MRDLYRVILNRISKDFGVDRRISRFLPKSDIFDPDVYYMDTIPEKDGTLLTSSTKLTKNKQFK